MSRIVLSSYPSLNQLLPGPILEHEVTVRDADGHVLVVSVLAENAEKAKTIAREMNGTKFAKLPRVPLNLH